MPSPSPASSGAGANQARCDLWEAHQRAEFELKDADAAIDTMTAEPSLVHVPIGAGAFGREALRRFYAEVFIPQLPDDIEPQVVTRTVTGDRLIEEFVLRYTHTVRMDWATPGVPPTGQRVAVPHVAVIDFHEGLIAAERIWWDQATLLAQLGILPDGFPVLAARQADRVLDPSAPANPLEPPARVRTPPGTAV
ncbi:MAG: ester cyclase [Acidimicrobiia bacterium]|nr:ester cyclase [Acidimicrobiia bacterium]